MSRESLKPASSQSPVVADDAGQLVPTNGILQEYADVIDTAVILVRDTEDRIVRWAKGAEACYGFTAEEALGKISHRLLQTEFPEPLQHIKAKLYNSGRWQGELTHTTQQGLKVVIESVWTLHRDSQGEPRAILEIGTDITARKRAEQALRESEAKYKALFESMDDGYALLEMIFDERGRPVDYVHLETNSAAVRIVGREMAGKRLSEITPVYEAYWPEIFAKVARTGKAVRLERYAAALGRWFSFYVFRPEGARPNQVVSIFRDISERKRTEEALRRSEQRLALAMEAGKAGAWERNIRTGEVIWSDQFRRMFGFGPEVRPSGEVLLNSVHPEDRAPLAARLVKIAQGEVPEPQDFRFMAPDGQWHWAAAQLQIAERDPDGKPLRIVGITFDISERKRNEEALRRNEQRLTLAMEAGNAAAWEVDLRTGEGLWSDQYRHMFGFSPEQPIEPHSILKIVHPADRPALAERFSRIDTGDIPESQDFRFLGPDGQWHWATGDVRVAERDRSGKPARVVGITVDITERKRRELENWTFSRMIDASTDLVSMADLNERLTFLNPGGRRMIGVDPEADAGTIHFTDYIPPQWHDFFREIVLPTCREEGHWEGEMQLRNMKTGALIDVHRHIFLIRNPQTGEPYCYATVARDITEQKRFEAALRRSEERLALAMEAGKAGAWERNLRTGELIWSDQLRHMFGFGPEQAASTEALLGIIHPADRKGMAERFSKIAQGSLPKQEDFRFRGRDGQWRWAAGQVRVAERDEDGNPVRLVGIAVDVTDRKRAEIERAETNALLNALSSSAPIGFALFDLEGRFRLINASLAATNGMPPEEHVGKTIREVVPEVADQAEHIFQSVVETGKAVLDCEFTAKTARFAGRYWSESWLPIKTPDGELIGVGVVVVETTDRRRAEEEAREAQERLQRVVESVGLGWFSYDLITGKLTTNAAGREHFGIAPNEEFTFDRGVQAIHPEHRNRALGIFERSLSRRGRWDIQFRTVGRDGAVRWIRMLGRNFYDASSRAVRSEGITIDITEQKRIEEDLRAANADLNQFAFAAAHDLREPLRNISVFSEVLTSTASNGGDPTAIRAKEIITEGVARMNELLTDLLEYRTAGEEDPPDYRETDCNAALAKALKNLAEAIAESGANIESGHLPVIRAQETKIVQLFQNLLSNAIKYRGSEPPKVSISASRKENEWLFLVKDNGQGIDPKYSKQIFGVFKRLHGKEIPGTGIGLAICAKIVESRGGRIWVESEPGKGSNFLFTWPARL